MPWLLRDGEVLAALEVASSRRERRRGLLGRDGIEGALLLQPARSVHTLGMRFALDVAYCRAGADAVAGRSMAVVDMPDAVLATLVVIDATTMARWRVGRPRWRALCVIEAEAGAFERWRLAPGDHLEVR